jgi:hypothetical protein
LTLPVLVTEKRLAAVRLVLIFGMVDKLSFLEFSSTRSEQHRHVAPFHPRRTFGLRDISYLRDNSVDQRSPEFRMGNRAAPERNRELNTMTVSDKALDVIYFEVHIVDAGRGAHLDFLDHADRVLLGIVRLLFLRVAVLVEVGDSAHRRGGGRGNLDQVKAAALCDFDSLAQRQDSDLAAVGVDNADFLSADQVVNANRGLS